MNFSITINAPKEKVWNTLWNDATYRQWTAPFSEGSQAVTDWKEGSKILFLDGQGSGMVSRVEKSVPNEYMGITHLGIVKDGVEDTESDEAKKWGSSYENYMLKQENGKTELKVEMGGAEIPKEFQGFFEETWPKALQKLKELSESK